MRAFSILFFWCLITTCYALKVIAIESPVIEASPYLKSNKTLPKQQEEPTDLTNYPLPITSHMQAGNVKRHQLKHTPFSQALFVVGDDELSRDWLKTHALELQKLNALGFVTNVATAKALRELIKLAGLPLSPVEMDDLAALLKVTHYPFVCAEGVVWQ